LNGDKLPLTVDEATGTMRAMINDPGEMKLGGRFNETPLRMIANLLSVISILVSLYLWLPIKQSVRLDTYDRNG
jgi:hypothetical protein